VLGREAHLGAEFRESLPPALIIDQVGHVLGQH
jgi:hypothetical protein